jgi:hypothetical protein
MRSPVMDPDAALKMLRAVIDTDECPQYLADLVGALDGWLTAGGFLPEAWAAAGRPGRHRLIEQAEGAWFQPS